MGFLQKLKGEYRRLQSDNPRRSAFWLLIKRVTGAVMRIVNAKFFLRRCTVGKMVTVRGRPRVDANGEIIIGDRVKIWSHISKTQISAGGKAKLTIGENTFINVGTIISSRHEIRIGKNCQIAPQVILMDSDFHGAGNHEGIEKPTPIIIEDDVWLASRAVVLKGVTVGKGAVVATGAVVTKDVPPYAMVAGIPAKIVRQLEAPLNKTA